MITDDTKAPFYAALELFRSRCLVNGKSLSLPDSDPAVDAVWTSTAARELMVRFVDSPDETKRSFMVKLRDQMAGAGRESVQLLVDLTWLHLVVSRSYRADTKRELLRDIAALGSATTPSGQADEALEEGLVSPGTSYMTRRPNQLWLLIRFVEKWVSWPPDQRHRLLGDPWAFRDLVFSLDGVADQTQRHLLLHLIHPDTFEDIGSQYHKRDIVEAFASGQDFDNVDRALTAVRAALTPEHGERFWFYSDQVRPLWDESLRDREAQPVAANLTPTEPPATEPSLERRAWLIRGSGGERVPEWLDRGLCAVYFEDSFPFAIKLGMSRDQLRAEAEEAGADITAGGFNNELGQVWRFVNAMAIGDYVVTVNGQHIYLGVVDSEAISTGERVRRETYRPGRVAQRRPADLARPRRPRRLLQTEDPPHPHRHQLHR